MCIFASTGYLLHVYCLLVHIYLQFFYIICIYVYPEINDQHGYHKAPYCVQTSRLLTAPDNNIIIERENTRQKNIEPTKHNPEDLLTKYNQRAALVDQLIRDKASHVALPNQGVSQFPLSTNPASVQESHVPLVRLFAGGSRLVEASHGVSDCSRN